MQLHGQFAQTIESGSGLGEDFTHLYDIGIFGDKFGKEIANLYLPLMRSSLFFWWSDEYGLIV